jgi:N-acetylglutamate synthase-like GNAT family acetyltransferase
MGWVQSVDATSSVIPQNPGDDADDTDETTRAIGAHLIEAACDRAAELDCTSVVAVTTSERVAGFFEHHGFERVSVAEIPAEKWREYDPARRARALCLRREL